MFLLLALALSGSTAAVAEQPRVCVAHMRLLIEDAERETGRVAGPTFFILDFWEARARADKASATENAATLRESLLRLRGSDPTRFQTDRQSCVDEAIRQKAVPGLAAE